MCPQLALTASLADLCRPQLGGVSRSHFFFRSWSQLLEPARAFRFHCGLGVGMLAQQSLAVRGYSAADKTRFWELQGPRSTPGTAAFMEQPGWPKQEQAHQRRPPCHPACRALAPGLAFPHGNPAAGVNFPASKGWRDGQSVCPGQRRQAGSQASQARSSAVRVVCAFASHPTGHGGPGTSAAHPCCHLPHPPLSHVQSCTWPPLSGSPP